MHIQNSFNGQEAVLYLVPTPIGNLEDMTFRAISILKQVSWIAAEDTRNTKKLCNYFEISTPLISHHEHNWKTSSERILKLLESGESIAVVSDAGMPAISDPGYELVAKAIDLRISVVALPGANAAITALIASGLVPQPFYFFGFLQRQKSKKKKQLEVIRNVDATIIFYEAPHRIKETLNQMKEVFGNRKMVLAREISKKFETYIRGDLEEIGTWLAENEIRGEIVLLVEGNNMQVEGSEVWWFSKTVQEHIDFYKENEQMKPNEAIKQVGKDRNMPRREVYQLYHLDQD